MTAADVLGQIADGLQRQNATTPPDTMVRDLERMRRRAADYDRDRERERVAATAREAEARAGRELARVQEAQRAAERQRPEVPAECTALAQTPDYPSTRLGPVTAAFDAVSRAYWDVETSCHPSDGMAWYYRESCLASVSRCKNAVQRACNMAGRDCMQEGQVFYEMRNLMGRPVGSQRFSLPADWASHQVEILHPAEQCDPAQDPGLAELRRRVEALSREASYLQQAERVCQRWWDWVRGICRMTR